MTGVALKCGWCGSICVNLYDKTLDCAVTEAPLNKTCVGRDGKCVVVSKYVTPTKTIQRITPRVTIMVTPKMEIPIVTMDPQPEVY